MMEDGTPAIRAGNAPAGRVVDGPSRRTVSAFVDMAFKLAETLEDAADLFDLMQDRGVTSGDVADFYVEPPGARPDPNERPNAPVRVEITRRLVRRRGRAEKVFVTGQKGAGKTMTLARIARDAAVTEHFVPLTVRATRHIPAGVADIRLVLVMLITRVSQFIDELGLDQRVNVGGKKVGGISRVLNGWVRLFEGGETPSAPDTFQNAKTRLNAQFLELSEEIVRDPQRRLQVLADSRYSVTELHRVVSALIEFAEEALALRVDGPRLLLLVIDDLDKYAVPSEVNSIFLDGMEALQSLPCSAVLTYPYFLNFTDWFVQREEGSAILNVKVAERASAGPAAEPALLPLEGRELLGPAREFFNGIYDGLASRALVLDQGVIDRAALLSAGIPREFLRLLSAGFEMCLDHQKQRLDLATLNVARIRLQQTMARTANEPWKQAGLKLVQTQGRILEFSEMLDTVHVVEYVNGTVWYGVHPAMEELVEAWIRRDRNLLLAKGAEPAGVERALEEDWRKAATTGRSRGG